VKVYVLRHAKAGSRNDWDGDDDLRPLSKPGRRQAEALIDTISGAGIVKIVSSPSVRCRQTVEPLAERVRLPVDLSEALAEGASIAGALQLVNKVAHEPTVLCTHGDVIGGLLDHAQRLGVRLDDDRLEKASMWVLEIDAGTIVATTYLPPPV
jgi:8-oxo-dGTP diphosphatase